MISNLEKYKRDLDKLTSGGEMLLMAIIKESRPVEFERVYRKILGDKYDETVKKIPRFSYEYQAWYSEALILIKQLLPDRLADFVKLYEKPKSRKSIEYGNYVIEDYLQNLSVTTGYGERKVGPEAAISQFEQQLNIVASIKSRFESSLFDIIQLVQADFFDSELETAKELNKKGFVRGAGAIAGVVLEKHLAQVCDNHGIKILKKDPSVNNYNQSLKDAGIVEVKDWRFIQRLADLRNLCDHNKKVEPKNEDIKELILGVEKISKTIF